MTAETSKAKTQQASRIGKVQVGSWVTPDLRKRLKVHAAETGLTVEQIIEEALVSYLDRHRSLSE